ncbi:hypothetical protein [Aidingimonas halophila]|uniref:Cytochrome oxidase Cu insertion factor, SCO1/SenC/PrrC family n=1 Tax=Aidingimonas halophila TaxID=574349 RepID=A0A1H3BZZ6_9GAMM|nr:hypothetical protein [Aidingimonas halophila]GHC27320.1 hypothetical protein GCM10008094_18650 [Aidingimonas halophila]SDX46819.1 hypothetical protein SAMN05443545_105358 [Aidingimonas halophila]
MTYLARQRCKLLALIGVFAAPLLAAWVMVELRIGIPDSKTAHGQLEPDHPVFEEWPVSSVTLNGEDWMLVFDCSIDCSQQADRWWRLHRALGREAPRVSRLRIGGDAGEALPGEQRAQWTRTPEWHSEGQVWVLDPEGKPVLSYSSDVSTEDVLDDIQLLLETNPEPPGGADR